MKKTLVLGLGLAMCLGLSACGKKQAPVPSVESQAGKGGLVVEENATLTGWLRKGKPVECKIAGPEGQMLIRVKDQAVRIEGVPYFSPNSTGDQPVPANGVILSRDNMTYMWDITSLKGSKMTSVANQPETAAGEAADASSPSADSQKDWSEMVGEWEAADYQYECNEGDIDDELFQVPSNVEFTDMDKILSDMQNLTNNTENMSGNPGLPPLPPLDKNTGMGLNQEDVEEMLEKAANEQAPAGIPTGIPAETPAE